MKTKEEIQAQIDIIEKCRNIVFNKISKSSGKKKCYESFGKLKSELIEELNKAKSIEDIQRKTFETARCLETTDQSGLVLGTLVSSDIRDNFKLTFANSEEFLKSKK